MELPQISFSAGVLDPAWHGRVNAQLYASGLKQSENALVLPQGGLWNRPGTKYLTNVTIAGSEDEAVCIPFKFSVDQSYVLVFVEGRMYVVKDGGMVQDGGSDYYLSTGLTGVDLSKLRYAQVADEIYITSTEIPPKVLTRTSDTSWTLATVTFGEHLTSDDTFPFNYLYSADASAAANSGLFDVRYDYNGFNGVPEEPFKEGYNAKYICQIVAENGGVYEYGVDDGLQIIPDPFESNDGLVWIIASYISGDGNWVLSTGATYSGWYYYNVNKDASMSGYTWRPDSITMMTTPPADDTEAVFMSTRELDGVNTALATTALWAWDDVDSIGFDTLYFNFGGANPNSIDDILLLHYASHTFNVYASIGNTERYGLIASSGFPYVEYRAAFTPQYNIQPFVDDKPIDATTPDATTYPLAVCFQSQRTWYGGATATPNQVNASILSNLNAFGYHTPLRDDDAIEVTIASTQVNSIQHLVPRDNYVLIFTDGAIWRAYGPGGIITPTTVTFDRVCDAFIADCPPLNVGERLLYTDRLGRVLELARGDNLVEEPIDRSLVAQHLLRGYTIVSWCYQNAPERTLWAVRSDGKVLSCTIVPELEVWAWCLHDFGGSDVVALSCSAIKEGARDKVYFVLQRTVNGSTVNYVEELQDRYVSTRSDAWFLDSGLAYSGTGTQTFSGLDHLEAETINLFDTVNGTSYTGMTVSSGAVTITGTATSGAVAGLPYTTTIETLDINAPDASIFGLYHNVFKVRIRLRDSMPFKAGQSSTAADLFTISIPDYGYYDSVSNLATGVVEHLNDSAWNRNGGVYFVNTNPTPMTIDAIVPEFSVEGEE